MEQDRDQPAHTDGDWQIIGKPENQYDSRGGIAPIHNLNNEEIKKEK